MLEDVYQNYLFLADVIHWKDYNQNELFLEYIRHENDSLSSNYYSGIVCRYWGYAGRLYNKCNKHVSFDQCYDVLIDSINYVLEKRVWENPESSLYKDPTGPDKAFHVALKRELGILLNKLTTQKRQSNFNTLSIDEMYENYSDSTEGLFKMATGITEENEDLVDFIKSYNDVNYILILDQICFSNWNSLKGVAASLKKITVDDFEYYNRIYEINKQDFLNTLYKYLKTDIRSLLFEVKKVLNKVRELY